MSEETETLKVSGINEVLNAIYLRKLSTKLDTVITRLEELTRIIAPPLYRFTGTEKYKFLQLAAGASGIVYEMDVPKDKVAIITEVANTWFANTYYMWSVDSTIERVQRAIAALNNPKVFETPMVAFNKIEWEAFNGDTLAHVFEVIHDGYYIDRNLYRKIVGI